MWCFKILAVLMNVSKKGGPFIPDDNLWFDLPEEAEDLLEPILEPYGQAPGWYFNKIEFDRQHPPWAIACLDRVYPIAGHIATTRPPDADISFMTYKSIPRPIPSDFVAGVGVLTFFRKSGLQSAADRSPVYQAVCEALSDCSVERRWLALLDPLPKEWLAEVMQGDRELWLSTRKFEDSG